MKNLLMKFVLVYIDDKVIERKEIHYFEDKEKILLLREELGTLPKDNA